MIEELSVEFIAPSRDEAMDAIDVAAKAWFGEQPFHVQIVSAQPELIAVTGDGAERFDQFRVTARVIPGGTS